MSTKRYFIIFTLFSFAFALCYPTPILANFLAKDNTVEGIIHIDPNDPIVGKQSNLFIELKDATGRLSASNCNCTVRIESEGKTLFTTSLFQNSHTMSLQNIVLPYTFPRRDIYDLTISGKPLTPNAFTPFTLTYTLQVDHESSDKDQLREAISFLSGRIIWIIGAGAILIFVLLAFVRKKLQQ